MSRMFVCPVCGQVRGTDDRFVLCDFCKNKDVIVLNDEEIKNIKDYLASLSREEFEKYIYFEKEAKYLYDNGWKKDKYGKKILEDSAATSEYLRLKYVFSNSLFDSEKYNQRIEWDYKCMEDQDRQARENARRAAEEASRPRCPKCGCTEFQMVPRKWSPLTGFLTNKVDRVCVKCKTRY